MAIETRKKPAATRDADLLSVATVQAKHVGQKFTAATDDRRAVRRTVQLYRDFIIKR